jgi:Periplasmic protease
MNSTNYYEKAATKDSSDTFGIIEYAQSQIKRTGSPIKNVVLDLSCNVGGALDSAAYTLGWVLAYGSISLKNTLTGTTSVTTYLSDTNMDHQFDSNDNISDKKVYCLTSAASFSCGNLVPNILKQTGKVTIIGQTSGGGTCCVQPALLADGTGYQFSGPRKMGIIQNGSFYDIEKGCTPDYYINDLSNLYNRNAFTSYLKTLK